MSGMLSRLEVVKLADELGVAEQPLAFLAEASVDDLRSLRTVIAEARYARHEPRLRRLAGLSKMAPAGIAAKISEHALGPDVSARVATMLDPADAAKLTKHLSAEFLTDISVSLDPARSADVISGLPDKLVIDVGRRLLKRGEHLTLARFVASYDVSIALAVLDEATGDDLLTMGMFAEDHEALDRIVAALPEPLLEATGEAADAGGRQEDAIAMLTFLSPATRQRLLGVLRKRPKADQDRFAKVARELGYADLLT